LSSPESSPESRDTCRVIDALFAAAATGVTADVLDWWHADGVLDDVTIAQRFRGHEQLYAYLEWYYRALPDLDFTPARIMVDGPLAAVEWEEVCHLDGPFDGIPADGRELRLRALDLFDIRDGRVAWESSWYGDGWLRERLELAPEVAARLPEPLPRGHSWGEPSRPDERGDTTSVETRDVITRLFAAAATGETEAVLRSWADDGVLDDVTIARRVTGKTELREYLDMYYRALPDLHFVPKRLLVDGPWALVEWAESCHLSASFDGVAGDGRELRLRGVDVFEVRNGLVARESGWYGDGWFRERIKGPDDDRLPSPLPFAEAW
jgi:steroid delta-isomerase-like uncharacterized protein